MRPLTQYFPLCVRGSGNYALVDKDQKRLCESIQCRPQLLTSCTVSTQFAALEWKAALRNVCSGGCLSQLLNILVVTMRCSCYRETASVPGAGEGSACHSGQSRVDLGNETITYITYITHYTLQYHAVRKMPVEDFWSSNQSNHQTCFLKVLK